VSVEGRFGDVTVTVDADHVATVELHRPPDNFFDVDLIRSIADAYGAIDADGAGRAIVLCAEGKHFCAGADFSGTGPAGGAGSLYDEAVRLFESRTPVVAAVQGAAIGGGLGLACSADFRVASPEARFAANFARLGFHHGFGLTVTLPAITGQQAALDLLYTGRRVGGDEALRLGLCDALAGAADLRAEAHARAASIAESAPLAVRSMRATMRAGLAERVRAATAHELGEQTRLQGTADWREGIRATAERRRPQFDGR
jgi:2-(1,2-epoxy-1,2-dihydrophenyl)acetyl-CoA isomerase